MNSKRFNALVENRLSSIKATLASKGQEYSTDDNKLHNFDKAAKMNNQTREQALKGFLLKHEVSVHDMIERTEHGIFPTEGAINEKIGDIINYYILLEACFIDRIENQK